MHSFTEISPIFPFSSVVLHDTPPTTGIFDDILSGANEMGSFEYGYCVTSQDTTDENPYFLFFFQRKPYAAGRILEKEGLEEISIRDFFIFIATNPNCRLHFLKTDPILLKSILVLLQRSPETGGSSEFLKLEDLVVEMMRGRKDSLIALIQEGTYNMVFAREGKAVKAYFSDQYVQSSGGIDWHDLFKRIEVSTSHGSTVRIQIYEDLSTNPGIEYLEGEAEYPGGVYGYYTRAMAELIVRDKTRTLKRISVTHYPFTIGRGDEADLSLNDPGISRKHASFEEKDGKLIVKDLDSLNGIFVNDNLTKEYTLQDGDKVTLGGHHLHVVLARSPAEDVNLLSPGAMDETMAMDRHARIKVACPECGAVGSLTFTTIMAKKKIRIRCPKCTNRFIPAGMQQST